jgi:hypothetical protein
LATEVRDAPPDSKSTNGSTPVPRETVNAIISITPKKPKRSF